MRLARRPVSVSYTSAIRKPVKHLLIALFKTCNICERSYRNVDGTGALRCSPIQTLALLLLDGTSSSPAETSTEVVTLPAFVAMSVSSTAARSSSDVRRDASEPFITSPEKSLLLPPEPEELLEHIDCATTADAASG